MKALILLVGLLSFGQRMLAQNFLMNDSTSSYFFQGNIGKHDKSIYTSGIMGYTINGRLDMSMLGGYSELMQTAKFFFISPTFDYLFIKQGKIPISVGLFGSYEFKNFYESYGILRHNTGRIGINVYREVRIGKNISIIPSVYTNFTLVRREMRDIEKDHQHFFEYGIKNSVRFKNFTINQRFSYFRGTYLATVGVGLYLMKTSKIEPLIME